MGVTRLQPGACCGCGGIRPCTGCTMPTVLHVTDDFQTTTCNYIATIPGWVGCYQLPVALQCNDCNHDGPPFPPPDAAGFCTIYYRIFGNTGVNGACNMQLFRGWSACNAGFSCGDYANDNIDLATCVCPGSFVCPDGRNSRCGDYRSSLNSDNYPTPFNGCNMPISLTLSLGSYLCQVGSVGTVTPSPLGPNIVLDL